MTLTKYVYILCSIGLSKNISKKLLRHIATGLTNLEIGDRLFISLATARSPIVGLLSIKGSLRQMIGNVCFHFSYSFFENYYNPYSVMGSIAVNKKINVAVRDSGKRI